MPSNRTSNFLFMIFMIKSNTYHDLNPFSITFRSIWLLCSRNSSEYAETSWTICLAVSSPTNCGRTFSTLLPTTRKCFSPFSEMIMNHEALPAQKRMICRYSPSSKASTRLNSWKWAKSACAKPSRERAGSSAANICWRTAKLRPSLKVSTNTLWTFSTRLRTILSPSESQNLEKPIWLKKPTILSLFDLKYFIFGTPYPTCKDNQDPPLAFKSIYFEWRDDQ